MLILVSRARQHLDEVSGAELAALVGGEDFWLCVTVHRFLNSFDVETRLQRDRKPSKQQVGIVPLAG
jgi:hypothetical protein